MTDRSMPPGLPASTRPPLPGGYYALGCASFVPMLGVVVGIIAIVLGLAARRKGGRLLALLGAGGIAFSVVLYGGLFYFGFMQRGGVYDDLRAQMAQSALDELVPQIEFYRMEHGAYPATLQDLRRDMHGQTMMPTFDMSSLVPRPFYYERVGNEHYYLRGVGPDGKPFTADDLVPAVDVPPGSGIGLLKRRAP